MIVVITSVYNNQSKVISIVGFDVLVIFFGNKMRVFSWHNLIRRNWSALIKKSGSRLMMNHRKEAKLLARTGISVSLSYLVFLVFFRFYFLCMYVFVYVCKGFEEQPMHLFADLSTTIFVFVVIMNSVTLTLTAKCFSNHIANVSGQ